MGPPCTTKKRFKTGPTKIALPPRRSLQQQCTPDEEEDEEEDDYVDEFADDCADDWGGHRTRDPAE